MDKFSSKFIVEIQKEMTYYAAKNSATIQARKVVSYIESFLNGKPDKDILHSIQNPLN